MNRIPPATPARPFPAARRNARTRTEAATDLVRLEFEAARLDRELAQGKARTERAGAARAAVAARIRACLTRLARSDDAT
jgi:hypothetical protein